MEYKFCGGQKLLAEKSREIWSEMCPGTKGWVWKICNPENTQLYICLEGLGQKIEMIRDSTEHGVFISF